MVGRQYVPYTLSLDERPFQNVFDQLVSIFGAEYQILVQNKDFARVISAGILNYENYEPKVGVSICLKYGGVTVSNPINSVIIERAYRHLTSTFVEDLLLNFPK